MSVIFTISVKNTYLNNIVAGSIVAFVPSIIYFGIRKKKNWKKIILGSVVIGLLFSAIIEFIAHVNLAWWVPVTIFPFRILGASTIDALIGYIPMTMFILVFYEHFFDTDRNHKISPHIWRAIIPAVCFSVLIVIVYILNPGLLMFKYSYLIMGLVSILLTVIQSIRSPKLFFKYSALAISLFFVFFIFEVAGVSVRYWVFPGTDYIGMVNFLGQTFPIEEIFFWMLLYPPTIAAYYEYFIDDEK